MGTEIRKVNGGRAADHVVLLGTKGGPAIRPGSAMPTSALISMAGQVIVVDCGLGVTRGWVDQGLELKDLKAIFITHLHSDHYLELGPLLHTAWTAGLKTPVTIWGPAGIDLYWHHFLASMQADIDLRIADEGRPDLRGLVQIHTMTDGPVAAWGELRVDALRNLHPPLIDTFALRFTSPTRRVVFSGDTAPLPALADFASGADLLVHEAMLLPALAALVARVGNGDDRLMVHLQRAHSSAEDAAVTAATAGVKRLALHHLIPADDPAFGPADWDTAVRSHFGGSFILGQDGLRIDLDD